MKFSHRQVKKYTSRLTASALLLPSVAFAIYHGNAVTSDNDGNGMLYALKDPGPPQQSLVASAAELQKERCVVTVAHVEPSDPGLVYYQHHAPKESGSTGVHSIKVLRDAVHPDYSETSEFRVATDIALLWLKPYGCKEGTNINCQKDGGNDVAVSWAPHTPDYSFGAGGLFTFYGYGANDYQPVMVGLGIKRKGQSEISQMTGVDGSNYSYYTITKDPLHNNQTACKADSGGPLMANGKQSGVIRGGLSGGQCANTSFDAPGFAGTKTSAFLDFGIGGTAAKFCRAKMPSSAFGIQDDPSEPGFGNLGEGRVTGLVSDPVHNEYPDEIIDCGFGADPEYCTSANPVIKFDVTATPKGLCRFTRWEGTSCPCDGSTDPHCVFEISDSAGDWYYEESGTMCTANFTSDFPYFNCEQGMPI